MVLEWLSNPLAGQPGFLPRKTFHRNGLRSKVKLKVKVSKNIKIPVNDSPPSFNSLLNHPLGK